MIHLFYHVNINNAYSTVGDLCFNYDIYYILENFCFNSANIEPNKVKHEKFVY